MAETKYGFINKSGEFLIDPMFDSALDFVGGMAAVQVDKKWGFIDKEGCVVIEPQYDEVSGEFRDGRAWVQVGNEFFYIDKTGKKIRMLSPQELSFLNEEFSLTEGQRSGCTMFKNYIKDEQFQFNRGGKVGLKDRDGNIIVEPKFELIDLFHEGLARARYEGRRGFVDRTGNFVIEIKEKGDRLSGIGPFCEGLAPIKSGGKWGFIDKTGDFVIKPKYDDAWGFEGGCAYVKLEGKYGVIDRSGNVLFEPEYIKDEYDKFHDGLAVVRLYQYNKCGYVDVTRHTAIAPIFDEAYDFNEGYARVGVNKIVDTQVAFSRLPRRSKSVRTSPSTRDTTNSTKQSSTHQASSTSSGCYIATAVYGSYDCPEVWTLRRYRDNVLDNSWYGRLFIKCYYAISPTLVKWFGESKWFRNIFSKPLNRWVNKLNENGFENTPYNDKY